MTVADSDRVPLFGTAMRSMECGSWEDSTGWWMRVGTGSEMSVDVRRRESAGDHHDLQVVDRLRDLLRELLVRLVFGGHPDLRRLLDDLLPDLMDARVQLRHGGRALRSGLCFLREFREQGIEVLHTIRVVQGPRAGHVGSGREMSGDRSVGEAIRWRERRLQSMMPTITMTRKTR